MVLHLRSAADSTDGDGVDDVVVADDGGDDDDDVRDDGGSSPPFVAAECCGADVTVASGDDASVIEWPDYEWRVVSTATALTEIVIAPASDDDVAVVGGGGFVAADPQ